MFGVGRPVGGAGEVEAQIAHGPHQGVEFEQGSVLLKSLGEVIGLIRRPETTPGDQICARRNSRGWVELEERELFHHWHESGWPGGIEQLGTDGDSPGLDLSELVHRHRLRDAPGTYRPHALQ